MSELEHRPLVARPTDDVAPGAGPGRLSSLALDRVAGGPVPRETGPRAELRSLEVALEAARRSGDVERERRLAATVARRLASEGRRIREAVKLARRSLLMGEDAELREELSGWFAGVGQHSLAAGTLRPLLDRVHDGPARAAVLLRIAVLSARDEDGPRAAAALKAAAEADRNDPLPCELLGALQRWAPAVVSEETSARAFIEASGRHEAKGDLRAAADTLTMALEVSPGHLVATERVAMRLAGAGEFRAADETWRRAALNNPEAPTIHARRVREALGAGDVPTALGAAYDLGSDCGLDIDGIATAAELVNDGAGATPVPNFDGLLAPAGLQELLAARLELAAERHRGEERARLLLSLARLLAGPVGEPRRALRALQEALVSAPHSDAVYTTLIRFADAAADVESVAAVLVRIARLGEPTARRVCLERLVGLSQADVIDHSFGEWATAQMTAAGAGASGDAVEDQAEGSWSPDTVWPEVPLGRLRAYAEGPLDPRYESLKLDALLEMRRRDPEAQRWGRRIEQLLFQHASDQQLEAWWHEQLQSETEAEHARCGLARLYRSRGAPVRAMELLLHGDSHSAAEAAMASALSSLVGKTSERATGLARLAKHARPAVAATLYAIAAELVQDSTDSERARQLAELACRADARALRPLVALLSAIQPPHGRVAQLALEHLCESAPLRLEWCRALALIHSSAERALHWARRWATLSLLDAPAASELIERLIALAEPDALLTALDWFLAQPMPLGPLVSTLCDALEHLRTQRPDAALALARRMVGVFGVADQDVVRALYQLSEALDEKLLQIAVLERRFLVVGTESATELLRIARLRHERGQTEYAYDALARALECNADPHAVERVLRQLPNPTTSDGKLLALEVAVAVQQSNTGRGGDAALAASYRQLGAAHWDLAGDRTRAVAAWEQAARLDPEVGERGLASDLLAFCGYQEAPALIAEVAERRGGESGATLLLAAAELALQDGFRAEAFGLALSALRLWPGLVAALAVVDESAQTTAELESAYHAANGAVLGRFGERALTLRAARRLVSRKEPAAAFEWATRSFLAVPGTGVSLAMLLRLAAELGRESEAAEVFRSAAERAAKPHEQARWLQHAAALLGQTPEGAGLRAEAQMRALSLAPSADNVQGVSDALDALFSLAPEERTQRREPFVELANRVLGHANEGELGALAEAIGGAAIALFQAGDVAADALRAALGAQDWDFEPEPSSWLDAIAAAPTHAHELLAAARSVLKQRQLGQRLLGLLAALSARLGEDVSPFADAQAKYEAPGGAGPSLVERARSAPSQDSEQVETWLEQAVCDFDGTSPAERREAAELLRARYEQAGDANRLEKVLLRQLDDPATDASARVRVALELAELLGKRGAHASALDMLHIVEAGATLGSEELGRALTVARNSQELQSERLWLERNIAALEGEAAHPHVRRLIEVLSRQGDKHEAARVAGRLLAEGTADEGLLELVAAAAAERQDWEAYANHLRHRLELSSTPPEALLLTLADTLAHRLCDPAAAAEALRRAIEQGAASHVVLERYALALSALGELEPAARAYERAARACREPRTAARLAELSVRGYLESGQLEPASNVLESKTIFPSTERLLELRVQVASRLGDVRAQAEALEELAFVSLARVGLRARWLLEAAHHSLAAGEPDKARARAQRAARIAPTDAEVLIGARLLEHRIRGTVSSDEALSMISELRGLGPVDEPELEEARVFLLATALERRIGPGAGASELGSAEQRLGLRPLIALALLEGPESLSGQRLGRTLAAVSDGDLRGVRTKVEVAELLRERRQRAIAHSDKPAPLQPEVDPKVVALPRHKSIAPRKAVPSELEPPVATSSALRSSHPSSGNKPPPKPIVAELAPEREALEEHEPPSSSAPTPRAPAEAMLAAVSLSAELTASDGPHGAASPGLLSVEGERPRSPSTPEQAVQQLRDLGTQTRARAERVALARAWLDRWPGHPELLEQLRDALERDQDHVAVRAVDHVLAVISGRSEADEVPELTDLAIDSTTHIHVVFSGAGDANTAIFQLLWQQAPHLFRSVAPAAGLVRVDPDGPSILSQHLSALGRLFGVARMPVFQGSSEGPTRHRLVLAEPPALILEGALPESDSTARLDCELAAWVVCGRPELVLGMALDRDRLALTLTSVLAAFGPPGRPVTDVAEVARVAEGLWEGLTPAAQRRLQELCAAPEQVGVEPALATMDRIRRRAGLLACARLDLAAAELLPPYDPVAGASEQRFRLFEACQVSPPLADLTRFACSAVYAQARFRIARELEGVAG